LLEYSVWLIVLYFELFLIDLHGHSVLRIFLSGITQNGINDFTLHGMADYIHTCQLINLKFLAARRILPDFEGFMILEANLSPILNSRRTRYITDTDSPYDPLDR
jgi:hypothetical protein